MKALLVALTAYVLSVTAMAAPAAHARHDARWAALKSSSNMLPAAQLGLGDHPATDELALVPGCMISLENGDLGNVQKQCTAAITLERSARMEHGVSPAQ